MISGKAAAVKPSVIYTWKSKVMNVFAGYSLTDVFNADETGLCFKQLPQKQSWNHVDVEAVSERRNVTDDIIDAQDYSAIDDELNVHECTEKIADQIVEMLLSKSNAIKDVCSEEIEDSFN
ncbi:hypothetical protein T09_12 [Trichinella sp. T9]|nr:hypothetical protein T09_12 [Trichinella sp. T9]